MTLRNLLAFALVLSAGAAAYLPRAVRAGDEWLPISPEDLKMTSEPLAPGAPAIYLYRQVDRDDQNFHEYNYARIKILTEEGRKHADVEIPFLKQRESIHSIRARTIHSDGSIVNFDGKVYEKTIVKARGLKYLAKTFTLPDVQVGSIIEYRYVNDLDSGYVFDSRWILNEELFTKQAKFTLKPNSLFAIQTSWPIGLPPGTNPPKNEHGMIHLETQNVPAFQIEDFMPPENELKYRVEFVYLEASNEERDADKFWKQEGKKQNSRVENFVGKRKAMEEAVAQVVSSNDSAETKLQKIYARVQQVHNLSFEAQKTAQEEKRQNLKETNNVEDVWKRGYAYGRDITWLFLALARAAGFEAYPVLVSRRNEYFFQKKRMNAHELDDNVVLVRLNGKDLYFDPGTTFTPFGLLPWAETGVQGLKLDKDGGTWVNTAMPETAASRIDRKADLQLRDDGSLEGKLTITFTGLEAMVRRMEQRNEDEANRKKFLEDQVREYIPAGIEVELTNKPDWTSCAATLVASYDLKVPGWVSGAGRRALVPVGLFGATEKHLFEHANRVHPVYFDFPFEKTDEVTIELPLGWKVNSMPPEKTQDAKGALYSLKVEEKNGALHLRRELRSDLLLLPTNVYPTLRNFFQLVRTGDEQQIVLQPGA